MVGFKERRRARCYRACALLGFVSLSICHGAAAVPVSGNRYGPPPLGDFLSEWTYQRAISAAGIRLRQDIDFAEGLVREPSSIYTDMVRSPTAWWVTRADATAADNAVAMLLHREELHLSDVHTMRMLAWDLGFTKALPGLQAERPAAFTGSDLAAASLYKAGVSVAVFDKALDLFGQEQSTIAANYAVAVQILVEKASRIPADEAERKGLSVEPALRFQQASSLLEVSAEDLHYLARILQSELSGWTAGRASIYGVRELPTPLRIARVAAAYRDKLGYMIQPCDVGGSAIPGVADTDPLASNPRLCMTDALDRHVYAWYRAQHARQSLPTFTGMNSMPTEAAKKALRFARPIWLGAYEPYAENAASQSEVVEYMVGTDLSSSGIDETLLLPLITNGIMHLCGVPRP